MRGVVGKGNPRLYHGKPEVAGRQAVAPGQQAHDGIGQHIVQSGLDSRLVPG